MHLELPLIDCIGSARATPSSWGSGGGAAGSCAADDDDGGAAILAAPGGLGLEAVLHAADEVRLRLRRKRDAALEAAVQADNGAARPDGGGRDAWRLPAHQAGVADSEAGLLQRQGTIAREGRAQCVRPRLAAVSNGPTAPAAAAREDGSMCEASS
jgi:hypothetical protein